MVVLHKHYEWHIGNWGLENDIPCGLPHLILTSHDTPVQASFHHGLVNLNLVRRRDNEKKCRSHVLSESFHHRFSHRRVLSVQSHFTLILYTDTYELSGFTRIHNQPNWWMACVYSPQEHEVRRAWNKMSYRDIHPCWRTWPIVTVTQRLPTTWSAACGPFL